MGNLAMSYSQLGRHADALAMQERVLEFRCRVLFGNHPDIGEWHVQSGVCTRLVDCEGTGFS